MDGRCSVGGVLVLDEDYKDPHPLHTCFCSCLNAIANFLS